MDTVDKICVTVLLCVGIVCGLGGCYYCEQTNQKAIEKGLVQRPASQSKTWTKPDAKD